MKNNPLVLLIKQVLFNGEQVDVKDWAKLFAFSKGHSLGTLFYYATKDRTDIPEDTRRAVLRHYLAQINQQAGQDYLREKLFCAFNDRKIDFLPIKGLLLRDLYPKPEMRTSCDVDFLYKEPQKQMVEKVLTDFGFTKIKENFNHGEWTSGIVTVENHQHLYGSNDKFFEYYKDVWDKVKIKQGNEYAFTNEDFYVYFTVHSAKHFATGGFGMRTLIDTYLYTQKTQLNYDYVSRELSKLGLDVFEKKIKELCLYLFSDGEKSEEMDALAKYVLLSGTYGQDQINASIKARETNVGKAKKRFWLRTIFPSFKTMKTTYPWLKKLPFLLPVAWVIKWFTVIFSRPQRIKQAVKNAKEINSEKQQFIFNVMEITNLNKD